MSSIQINPTPHNYYWQRIENNPYQAAKAQMPDALNRFISVKGEYEGFHKWEDAPEEVAFLRNSHRHVFKWECNISVKHDDRELEFFMVKMFLEREVLPYVKLQANLGSCEMQAERILEGLVNKYGTDRWYCVTVSEDGENDGYVIWDTSY